MVGSIDGVDRNRLLALLVVVGVLLGTVGAPITLAAAQEELSIRGEPDLSVTSPAPTLAPGQTTELTLQVTNDGELDWGSPDQRDAVVTARDVEVEATADDAPFAVDSGVMALGAVGEERPREVAVAVTVPDDAEPGTYDLEVDVSYSHVSQYWTSGTTQYSQDHSHTTTETIEVDVEDTARFELSNVTTDAQVGSDGRLDATIANVGSERAEDVRLALESKSPSIAFGDAAADEVYVGALDPGETAQVRTDVTVGPDASVRNYSIGGSVTYADADGLQRQDPDLSVGVAPVGKQTLRVTNSSGPLRAGEERELSVTIRNDGPQPVEDPVVALDFQNPNVYLDSPQLAIENLEPNETAMVTYDVDVSSAVQGSRQGATVTVNYTDTDGDRRQSDPMATEATIEPERDQFEVAVVNGSISAGSTDTVELRVTNVGDRRLSEIEAKAYLEDPLDSEDDEAMIPALDPGESATTTFEVSAAESAPAKTYALSTDFHYEQPDGDAELSRSYAVPIEVEPQPEPDVPIVLVGGAIAAIVVVIVAIWQRNRLADLLD